MKKNYLIYMIAVIISAVILNGITVTFIYSSDNFYVYGDMILTSDTVRAADALIGKYSYDDYPVAYENFYAELEDLYRFRTARNVLSGDISAYIYAGRYTDKDKKEWAEGLVSENQMTDEQIKTKISQLEFCLYRIGYALDFSDFVDKTRDNSDKIISASFINSDSFAYRNALKTGRDFNKLEGVKISAESDMGISRLFEDKISDVISLLAAAACAVIFYMNFRSDPICILKKSSLFIMPVTVSAAASAVYLFNIYAVGSFLGNGSLMRSVQSSDLFSTCTELLNMGALMGIRIVFKILFILIFFLIISGILFSGKKIWTAAFSALFLLEIFLYSFNSGVFSKINIFSSLSFEKIFGKYENMNILGNAVGNQNVFVFFMGLVFIAACIFYHRQANIFASAAVEAEEKRYCDEITRKQEETRRIRHDMSNHLRALSVLINSGDYTAAKGYINEISGEIYSEKIPSLLSRAVPDALIFSKIAKAEEAGITVNAQLDTDYGNRISDYDLCTIFGNLLDNAVEGMAENIPQCEKVIDITAGRRHDLVCIVCKNPCSMEKINRNFETSKSDRTKHGYGLRSIKRLVLKYGGGVEISAENGVFTVTVLISVS